MRFVCERWSASSSHETLKKGERKRASKRAGESEQTDRFIEYELLGLHSWKEPPKPGKADDKLQSSICRRHPWYLNSKPNSGYLQHAMASKPRFALCAQSTGSGLSSGRWTWLLLILSPEAELGTGWALTGVYWLFPNEFSRKSESSWSFYFFLLSIRLPISDWL